MYSATILHLKACGTLEAVHNAIWGEDRPWITDPALASKGAKDAGAAEHGATTLLWPYSQDVALGFVLDFFQDVFTMDLSS